MSFPAKPGVRGVWLAFLIGGPFLALFAYSMIESARRREQSYQVDRMVGRLKDLSSARERNEFSAADVAGLHSFGLVSREIAEADSAPMSPLVPRPVPYYGYFALAVEPPAEVRPEIARLPERDRPPKFAYCIYPADPDRPDLGTYLVCPWGVFKRYGVGKVSRWPEDPRRFWLEWGTVD
jgi:hypothetical protein